MSHKKDIYTITTVVFIIDQVIKILIMKTMSLYQKITIIPNFFSIFYVKNTGAAFSILEDNTTLLIIIGVLFMLGLSHYIKKEESFSTLSILSFGLLLGGIFGNLLDRIIQKGVVDYLSFVFFHYEYPVFNLADICICVGIFLFIVDSFLEKKGRKNDGTLSGN